MIDDLGSGIEPDFSDRVPIAGRSTPTLRMTRFGLLIDRLSVFQDGVIKSFVSLMRGDELDSAVAVLVVIPAHKPLNPVAGCLQAGKALLGVARAVFARAKERLVMWYTT